MSNRFLISVAAAALIAGTGFANAQGTGVGRDTGAGSTAQQSAPSSERGGASSGSMQREPGGASDMKGAQSEPRSKGAEKNQRADDQMKGGKDMKAEGKEDRGGKAEKGQTTGQGTGSGTMQRDQSTQRDQTQDRDKSMQKGDQKAGQQDRDRTQTQTQGGAAGQSTTTTGQAGAGGKLSTEQRTQITSVIREQRVSPVTNVNFSISVGTRVPRSVHLVALPASVISLVPQYRSYRYFVANDEICIVEPSSYEIVEVIAASDRTARGGDRAGSGMLTLTAEEKHIIIENVEMRGDSTLALGSLNEGSPVPREARLQAFPDVVVQKVPKVRGYKFFTAEDRIAIADEQGSKVALVIDAKR